MGLFGIVVTAFVVVWLQGLFFRRFGFSRVRYERSFGVRDCMEGDQIELIEVIANDKPLPVPWLRLESLISTQLVFPNQSISTEEQEEQSVYQHYHKSLFVLMPFTQIVRRHKVVCRKRGCYRLQTASMTCGDPFGLFQAVQQVKTELELLVYPVPEPIPELQLPSRSWNGETEVRRWIVEDPFRTAGVREYRAGDPLKSIHWKSSARSGTLQVHVRDFTAEYRIMVLINFDVTEQMWKAVTDPDLIERGIRMAAFVCEQALQSGMETGFGCNGRMIDRPKLESVRIRPGIGGAQHQTLLETMARLLIERTVGFATFLEEQAVEAEEVYDYVLITAYVNEAMRSQIARLEANGSAVRILPLAHPDAGGGRNDRTA